MARRIGWSQMIPGVLALAAIVTLVIATFVFARVGALRGDTMRLYAPTSQARGVIKGTEVWVAGQKVGLVEAIRFRPVTTDTSERVVLVLEMVTRVADQVRRDSYAQIRIGTTLIGAPVIFIAPGSPGAPHLMDGDTLATRAQGDVEGITSRLAYASRDFPALLTNFRLFVAQLDSAAGTAGAILNTEGRSRELSVFQRRAERLTQSMASGNGTVALALRRGDLIGRAQHAVAQIDSIRTLLASERTALGRFRRDSTLAGTLAGVQNELSITRALLAGSRGTAGRATADSAIVRQLSQLEAELGALVQDVKQRPLRYVAF